MFSTMLLWITLTVAAITATINSNKDDRTARVISVILWAFVVIIGLMIMFNVIDWLKNCHKITY